MMAKSWNILILQIVGKRNLKRKKVTIYRILKIKFIYLTQWCFQFTQTGLSCHSEVSSVFAHLATSIFFHFYVNYENSFPKPFFRISKILGISKKVAYLNKPISSQCSISLLPEYCFQGVQKQNMAEAVVRRFSVKKLFLKISQNSQENTCVRVSICGILFTEHFWQLLLTWA